MSNKPLSQKEARLVKLILESGYSMDKAAYAKTIGVSVRTIDRMLARSRVADAVNNVLEKTIWPLRLMAYRALEKALEGGSVPAAKVVLKIVGDYSEVVEVTDKRDRLNEPFNATRYLELLAEVERIRLAEGDSKPVGDLEPSDFEETE